MSKNELLERLRQHPLYKAALSSVDETQRQRIAAIAEGFLTQASQGLGPLITQASDPVIAREAKKVLDGESSVVINEPEVSGSVKA